MRFFAVVAFTLLVLGVLLLLFRAGSDSGPGTIVRVANSHYNSDGRPKIEYATRDDAERAAVEHQLRYGDRMSVYLCAEGNHWHIGHAR